MRQPDLFGYVSGFVGPPRLRATSIPGLRYEPSFISREEEHALVKEIDQAPWLSDLKRRVQHYGWRYDYKARKVDAQMYLGPLPTWLDELAHRVVSSGWFSKLPDQAIVNEYEPGQGIAPHVDCVPCFGPTVASISLLSSTVMDFTHLHTAEHRAQILEPRSIVVMRDAARREWKHAIASRMKDEWEGRILRRIRRISITFRTVVVARKG